MKTLTIIAILILTVLTGLTAEENSSPINFFGFIDFHTSVEIGYMTIGADSIYNKVSDSGESKIGYSYSERPYAELGSNFVFWKMIRLGGWIRSVFTVNSISGYDAKVNRYIVYAEFFMPNLKVGFSHSCEHDMAHGGTTGIDRIEEKAYVKVEF